MFKIGDKVWYYNSSGLISKYNYPQSGIIVDVGINKDYYIKHIDGEHTWWTYPYIFHRYEPNDILKELLDK